MIAELNEASFDRTIASVRIPVVVDFHVPWCGPCKTLSPRLDKLAGKFSERIKFVSVNVDQSQSLATKFDVQGIHTLLFIGKDGQVVGMSVGLLSEAALRAKLETLAKG